MKTLEEKGIGRPSTYASIMQTIQDRGYVWKKGQALVPTTDAFAVVALLEQHFTHLVDYEFTARMEDDLDEIAGGRQQRVPWLHQFWFGNGDAWREGPEGPGARGGRRRGDQHDPARRRRERRADRGPQRPLRAVPPPGRRHRVDPRGPSARRAHHRPRRGDPVGAEGRRAARRRSRDRPAGVRQERPVRSVRAARRRRHAPARHEAEDVVAVPDDVALHAHARRGAAAAAPAAHGRRRTPRTARRSSPPTAATAPT